MRVREKKAKELVCDVDDGNPFVCITFKITKRREKEGKREEKYCGSSSV